MNVLCGLVKPTAGEIICDGISLYSLSSDNIDELRKKYFSIIFQDQKTFDQLTLKNHIKLVLKLNYLVLTEEKKKEIEEILQKLKLIEHINKKIVSLSGGEKSRVSIAMALIKNSHVIIADEPTASQDAENAELVFNILKEISKTKLVILISHACQRAIEISDCYFELDKGQIKNYQPKNDLNKDNNTITFTKSHLFKNFSIFKYTNKKNKFDSIFTFIFLTLSLVFSTLSFSIMSFNQAKFAKDYLAKSNINYIMVDEDENTQLDLNKIPEKNLLKSYKYLDILGDINPNELNKYYTSYYINRVVFDEEVPNDSIYVTDWICECLKYYKKISYDNYQDVINQKIEIKNHKFTIKKVIDTGILDLYPMSTTLSDENIYVKYAQTLEERTLIYLNKATFLNNLYDSSNNLRVDIGINQYEIASLNNITLFLRKQTRKR